MNKLKPYFYRPASGTGGDPKLFKAGDVLPAGQVLITGYIPGHEGEFIVIGSWYIESSHDVEGVNVGDIYSPNYIDVILDLSSYSEYERTVTTGGQFVYWEPYTVPATLTPLRPYFSRPERGVEVGDILNTVTWADVPTNLAFSEIDSSHTLLSFDDDTSIYTEVEHEMVAYYRVKYGATVLALGTTQRPTSWINPTFDFGGREVKSISPDESIKNVIRKSASMTPLTAYFNKHVDSSPIYGVSGLYQSSPALTRTDDAVGMGFAINSSTGAISSDFNSVFPWNEATVETIDGNVFLHMPEMWFRVGYDASKRITDVAVSKQASGAGNWYKVNPFYYSCYGGSVSGGKLKSVSGVRRQANATRAQFRTYAAANGSGYFQRDLYHSTVMSFLWWIEWATKDSSSIMTGRISGSGTSGGATVRPTGRTNSVSTPSGFETAYAQMRYHYIEDFIGNMLEFVDGSVGSGSSYYVTASPAAYSDATTGHANLPYGYPSNASSSNRCISAFGWDADNPFLCQPIEQVGTDYTIHFCDENSAANNVVLYCGAYYANAIAAYGLSYYYRDLASRSYPTLGGRLLYKP